MVVESEGSHADLNVRNGRRLLNFGSVSDTMKNRLRPTRTKEASMASLEDLHPDAIWCSERNLQALQQNNLKVVADGSDLKDIDAIVLDPEEVEFEMEMWSEAHNPPPEHTMDLHDCVDTEAVAARLEEKEAKRLKKFEIKETAKKAKAAARAARKKAPKPRKLPSKSKKARPAKFSARNPPPPFEGFEDYYPPVGHMIEFEWGDDWYEGEFIGMEIDEEDDELVHIRDAESDDIHNLVLRERDTDGAWSESTDWFPLFECFECDILTRGKAICEICYQPKDGPSECPGDSD